MSISSRKVRWREETKFPQWPIYVGVETSRGTAIMRETLFTLYNLMQCTDGQTSSDRCLYKTYTVFKKHTFKIIPWKKCIYLYKVFQRIVFGITLFSFAINNITLSNYFLRFYPYGTLRPIFSYSFLIDSMYWLMHSKIQYLH